MIWAASSNFSYLKTLKSLIFNTNTVGFDFCKPNIQNLISLALFFTNSQGVTLPSNKISISCLNLSLSELKISDWMRINPGVSLSQNYEMFFKNRVSSTAIWIFEFSYWGWMTTNESVSTATYCSDVCYKSFALNKLLSLIFPYNQFSIKLYVYKQIKEKSDRNVFLRLKFFSFNLKNVKT